MRPTRRCFGSRIAFITAIACSRWGDGFAIIGTVSGRPKGTGWLVKLDAQGKFLWQKFADYFSYGDVVEALNGGLFRISWPNQTSVVKIDSTGALVLNYPLPADSSDQVIVHPVEPRSSVRVAYMLSQTRTDVVELMTIWVAQSILGACRAIREPKRTRHDSPSRPPDQIGLDLN